jgi:hypothetical protein
VTGIRVAAAVGLLLSAAVLPRPAVAPTPAEASSSEFRAGRVHHSLRVALDPAARRLAVTDALTIPAGGAGEVQFLLNAALRVTASEPVVAELPLGDTSRFFGLKASTSDLSPVGPLKRYRTAVSAAGGSLRLEYGGTFDFGLADAKEEYTRGFRETVGIVSPQGVYLAGSGFWYPEVGPDLLDFDVEVSLPEGWHVISQGDGTSRDTRGVARWDSHGAAEEILLVGGPLLAYRDAAGGVEALVYLRAKDDALAGKYLQATSQYIEMYRQLIGPYPYGKFALVENFWETGYGMPSFTLLGPQVVRFPFILTSSLPHEILHNWWGNSVFVDYETGNWCEGLTSYMADHLLQEQRGKGEEYRLAALQRYRDYVKEGRDFPLADFRSRHSAATEAVGYGKTMMGFHMLRRRLGDDTFRRWAASFFSEYRGKRASFADVRRTLEAASGQDLTRFFADWVERPGAPALAVSVTSVSEEGGRGYAVSGVLRQTQGGAPVALDVPVVAQTAGRSVTQTVRMDGAETPFTVRLESRPLALHVDPSFDVFRRLDPCETPPSIGQIFGEPRILAALPALAPAAEVEAWRALVEGWGSESHQIEIRTDADVGDLPADRTVWLLGRENAIAARLFSGSGDYSLGRDGLAVGGERMPLAGHSAVLVRRHPANREKAVGWILADGLAALPGLGRKLPHYGKYSYLGFQGPEPTNVLKGQWTTTDSPLRVDLRPAPERSAALPALVAPPRSALAELPPAFSRAALLDHVAWLSASEREGRGLGSRGLEEAADYVGAQMKAMGLEPGGDNGTFFQRFASARSPSGSPVPLRNVIGVLPGTRAEWKGQSALLTAHYDHLGFGWPDVHKGDEGRTHPGADDNASGVAVMLEVARAFVSGERSQRTLVFVGFAGEEAGFLGSRHYVEHPTFPLDRVIGVINLDTVGRLRDKSLSVLAAGTASEWPHIFRGAGYVTGVESRTIPEALESSDQKSFIDRGVPAVQLFTDAHADYHRPGDTVDKIDGAGLVKVAALVRESLAYLAERPQSLTSTIAGAAASAVAARGGAPPAQRRVSFGTVPDFAFPGPGVKVAGVVAGSPAEKAGVKEGDVLLVVGGQDVANLQGFSDVLRGLTPGQTVPVVLRRGADEVRLAVTVVER